MGVLFGALGGAAFYGANAGLQAMGLSNEWGRYAVLAGVGAGISGGTGGWKGLVTFGAGLAGALTGRFAGAAIFGKSQQPDLKYKADKPHFDYSERPRLLADASDVMGSGDVLSDAMPDYGGVGLQGSESRLSFQLPKPGYLDLNVSVGHGLIVTGGAVLDSAGGLHLYIGGGIGTTGVAFTISPNTLSTGWNYGVQGSFFLSVQGGYGGGSLFGEYGAGSPGVTGTGYYIGD